MRRITFVILIVLAFATGFACTALNQAPPPKAAPAIQPVGATLLDGLGSYRAAFSPAQPEAQRWFDQGLNLAYGFNHDAAERSFLKAIEADPACVMCWWGAALVLGPHVNATMDPANNGKAWMRVQKAASLAGSAGALEQAYVRALSTRYAAPSSEGPPPDRKPLDEAYAQAMEQVVWQFPDDLDAAEETSKRAWIPDLIRVPDFAFLQDYWVTPLKAKVQFGRWDEIVATPKPPDDMAYPVAIWHLAQGMAAVRQNRLDEAGKHLAELAKTAADPAMEKLLVGPQHPLSGTLKVAERVLAGELAAGRKDYAAAIGALRQAVKAESDQAYFEPPMWYQPTRQSLGNVLLRAGKSADAEKVFREDLKDNRGNGWALFGLAKSLRAQKKVKEAAKVEQEFQRAWRHADLKLTAAVL